MFHRHIKLVAVTVGVGFCAAAVYVVCWSVMAPERVDAGGTSSDREVNGQLERHGEAESLPPLELRDFEPLWARKFRPPLVDSKPPPKPAPAPPTLTVPGPPPELDLELVGTLIEPGRSRAVFSDANGKILLGGVGDKIGDGPSQLEIVEIDTRSVVVQHSGRQSTLELRQSEKADETQELDAPRSR